MSVTKKTALIAFILIAAFAANVLAGCNGAASTPTPTPVPVQASPTALPTATTDPGAVWFIAPAQADPSLSQAIAAYLQQAASQAGLSYATYPEFRQSELPKNLKVAVLLDPASEPDPASLATSLPDTQFILIGDGLPQASGNLSVVDTQLDQRVFVAGYIATLVADDFRSGGLFSEGDPLLASKQDSFMNGGQYLCGRCVPVYPPLVTFPQIVTIPAQADAGGMQTAFDQLNQDTIQTLYLPAEAYNTDFLTYLAGQNVAMLGLQTPPDGFSNNWITTVQVDAVTALDQVWSAVLAGQGGQQAAAVVSLADTNANLLSPGRQEMVKDLISELAGGWVVPGSVE